MLCCRFDVGKDHEGNRWGANVDSVGAHPVCQVLDYFHVSTYLFAVVKGLVQDFDELLQHVYHRRAVGVFECHLQNFVNCAVIHTFEITIAGLENTVGDVGTD